MMKLWQIYIETVNRNCLVYAEPANELAHWQNRLFSRIIIYLLPLGCFAMVPGIIMSIRSGIPALAFFDLVAVLSIAFISFRKKLHITIRKFLFIMVLYLLAIILLYYLGSFGPGLLYLLGITIFVILIFPNNAALWSLGTNTCICLVFGILIYNKAISSPLIIEYSVGSWIAVSANLVILSTIVTFLLPTIFRGLQNTIEEQEHLKMELKVEQHILKQTLELVNYKNSELEQFAYMVSHDLQEPLRIITGFLTQLEKKYNTQLDEKAHQYIYFASDGAERMKKTIADLLQYSVAGKKEYEIQIVDLNLLLQDYTAQNNPYLAEQEATILWSELPSVKADKPALQQVFQNLIGNAIKYQKKGTKAVIRITATETKKHWQLAISDNGIGINAEFFEKIFIVFQRLHNKTTYSGTGIGLAICKKIVENHKGKIWVESIPDQGSIFYFTLSK